MNIRDGLHVMIVAAKALAYFNLIGFDMPSHENLADFMMDVIAGMIHNRNDSNFHPAKLVQCWQQSKHTVKSMDAQLEVNERCAHTHTHSFAIVKPHAGFSSL
jgi:hypothetical protein